MKKIQIIYANNVSSNDIDEHSREEAAFMKKYGFHVGVEPIKGMDKYIFRGPLSMAQKIDNKNINWLNSFDAFTKTWDMTEYLPCINPWTFPSVIIPTLEKENLRKAMEEIKSNRVFIKNGVRSLFFLSERASVYPDTRLEKIVENFEKRQLYGPYIIRKFIDNQTIFIDEQRIWVLNGNPYSPYSFPDFIFDAAKCVYKFSGSRYFTIDIAGEYIVEVNPGESSDRGVGNSADWLGSIFANEFLKG